MAINKKRLLFNTFFIFMLFQQVLLQYTSGKINKIISYTDEATECVMICMILYMVIKGTIRLYKVEIVMLVAFIGYLSLGFISNMIYPMQSIFYNISDGLVCSRFIVAYYWTRLYWKEESFFTLNELDKISKIITIIMFILLVHDLLFNPIFPKADYRYFTYSISLFFPHPSYMAVACFTCIIILGVKLRENKKNLIYIIMQEICIFFTFRSKAIASILVVDVLYVMILDLKILSPTVIGGISGIGAVLVGWKSFSFYYLNVSDGAIRAMMHRDAITLANTYFPFGTGFATFGSNIAAKNYSSLYYQLGYNNYYGGGLGANGSFLCDTFWPIVLGQCGWIGFFMFVIVILGFIYIAIAIRRRDKYSYWMLLSAIAYELISSTSEPAFFNPSVFIMFVLIGIVVNNVFYKNE